ncbi:MAG: hypothetical protein V3W20_11695 [Candidatus Neomarinimicrobiota bacterium]
MGIKYLLILLPILLFSGDAIGQEIVQSSMCQYRYIQCNQNNQMRLRNDQRWCNSNAFDDTILQQNCLDKAQWDYQRRTMQCERRFQTCWWTYEEEDSFYPFPMR